MFNLQGSEIIFILLLALVVLGPEKLPSAIRRFTQTYAELRKMGTGFQTELKTALDEPMREMKETAGLLRDAADPTKMVADAEAATTAAVEADRDAERKLRAQEILDQRSARAADGDVDDVDDVDDSKRPEDADGSGVIADPPTRIENDLDEWADPVDPVDSGDSDETDVLADSDQTGVSADSVDSDQSIAGPTDIAATGDDREGEISSLEEVRNDADTDAADGDDQRLDDGHAASA